jgi:hypothetical protein
MPVIYNEGKQDHQVIYKYTKVEFCTYLKTDPVKL